MSVDDEQSNVWMSFGTAVRLSVGWFSVVIGILNLIVEVDHRTDAKDGAYLVFHCFLVVGGVLLLSLGPGSGAGKVALSIGTVVAIVGMVVGTVLGKTAHGYPFAFLSPGKGQPSLNGLMFVADLLFWGYAGLFAVLAVMLVYHPKPKVATEPVTEGQAEEREPHPTNLAG